MLNIALGVGYTEVNETKFLPLLNVESTWRYIHIYKQIFCNVS